jgi:hypothetical protein
VKVSIKYKFFDLLFISKGRRTSNAAIALAVAVTKLRRVFPEAIFIFVRRILVSLIVPDSGFPSRTLEFEAVIPCSSKDNPIIGHCVQGLLKNASGCSLVSIVTPVSNIEDIKAVFREVPQVRVLAEEAVLPKRLMAFIKTSVPPAIKGWTIQQVIKIHFAQNSSYKATLAIDADTVLLKPRSFFYGESQQLLVATHEYHTPYREHIRRVWPNIHKLFELSLVPHHQLMQKELVRKMFGEDEEGIIRWLACGNFSEGSPFSEYESYGQFLLNAMPKKRYSIAKWGNASLSRSYLHGVRDEDSQAYLIALLPNHFSVSLHSYLP